MFRMREVRLPPMDNCVTVLFEDGAKQFAYLDPSEQLFRELVEKSIRDLGWSYSFAKNQLMLWQEAQKKLWEEIEKEKELEKKGV